MNWVKFLIVFMIVVGMTVASTTFFMDVSNGENISENDVLTLDNNPIFNVEHEVVVREYESVLKVKVTGDHLAYEILLYNPDAFLYDDLISKDDIRMGHATKYMRMTEPPQKSPPNGTYTLIIREQYNYTHELHNEQITFVGANVSIIGLNSNSHYYSDQGFGYISEMDIKFNNTGDLPFYIDNYSLHIGDDIETGDVNNFVLPGQETTIDLSLHFTGIPAGTHDVLIKVFYDGVLIDSYEGEVTMQPTNQENITIDDEVCVGPFAIMGIGAFAIPMMIARRRR